MPQQPNQVSDSLTRLFGTAPELLRLEKGLRDEGEQQLAEEVDQLAGRYREVMEQVSRRSESPGRAR